MLCGDCPLALPCFAHRLFENNNQGMICPKCRRFTHVQFERYRATTDNTGQTIYITGADLGLPLEVRQQLEQTHTIVHCPRRQLTVDQIQAWEKEVEGNPHAFIPTVTDPDCSTPVSLGGDAYTFELVHLNVVPCAACEPGRYGKITIIEVLEKLE